MNNEKSKTPDEHHKLINVMLTLRPFPRNERRKKIVQSNLMKITKAKLQNFYAFSIHKRITLHEAFYIIKTIHTTSHKIFAETRAEMY